MRQKRTVLTVTVICVIVIFAVLASIIYNTNRDRDEGVLTAMYVPYGTDSYIMVDQNGGAVFTVNMPDKIYNAEGKKITQEAFTRGNILEIYGNGQMAQSYPGQYNGVTKIVIKEVGSPEDADQYDSIIDEIYQEPDAAERPHLNVEFEDSELQALSTIMDITSGSYEWSYEDTGSETRTDTSDAPFILAWETISEITFSTNKPADLTLIFYDEAPTDVTVERWMMDEREAIKDGADNTGVEKGESQNVEKTGEKSQYVLKDATPGYVYRVTGRWENGTVEYGFIITDKTAQ